MRTPGVWSNVHKMYGPTNIYGDGGRMAAATGGHMDNTIVDGGLSENISNAKTVAIAGTAANEIDGFGFPGDEAIKLLPALIANMQTCPPDETGACYQKWEAMICANKPPEKSDV